MNLCGANVRDPQSKLLRERVKMTRREMLAIPIAMAATGTPDAAAADSPGVDFKLGICSYTFREFQRKMAIGMMKQLSVGYVSVKDFHLPYSLSPADLTKALGEFKKAGLTIVSAGNTDLKSEDPAELRRYFEYARNCGIPMLVAAPTHQALPAVEQLAKEFDIRVAIHTHGPEDPNFPVPKVVLDAIKGMDARMGMCLDVGHSMRGGADVVQEIANAGPRLFDMHIKDLKNGKDKDSQCEVGEGVMPIVAILKQLKKTGYRGSVNLEYEINSENPLPGAQHSIGYLKGVLAGLAG
jgi:sugar phosphate isomerase/epimerase